MLLGKFATSFKRYWKYIFILIICIYLCVSFASKDNIKNGKPTIQTRANAFIISTDCNSARFNFTKTNIHRVFPNFFTIYCFKPIPLTDPRIGKSLSLLDKKLASNLLSFVTIWTDEIPKYSTNGELEWSFVFEDDVNFIEPANVSLPNYISAIQELMHHPDVQLKHGAFYLGICGPTFTHDNRTIIIPFSNNRLFSHQGYGTCAHAMGLTTKRARSFWKEISSHFPTHNVAADIYVRNYCLRQENRYYTLGSNFQWPPKSGHYGIAYQDAGRFPTEVW
jgi:hypothetical protein